MQKHLSFLLIGAMSISLSACDPTAEMGSNVDEGNFGNPTMNNMLIQSGQISYQQALGERFAREVKSTVNFEFNSAVIDAEAAAILDVQANWIRQFPELRFRVYGHTDLVGSDGYNYALGKRRADAVVAYFAGRGISRSRLEALVSYGETQPVILTPNPEERNRRTVTEVSGFVQNHPAVLNGKYAQIIMRDYIRRAWAEPHFSLDPEMPTYATESVVDVGDSSSTGN
jgi:peptidoglycan-associated lipoprotein